MSRRRETGYAMVVAVAGMMAFAYVSFEAVAVNRGATIAVAGQVERARLKVAADSGIAAALNGLGIEDSRHGGDIPQHSSDEGIHYFQCGNIN